MRKNFWMMVFVFIGITLASCSSDDDSYSSFHYVSRGIDSIALADSATLGQRVEVRYYTKIAQDCQAFQTHGYDIVGNERTVTAWFIQYDDATCGEDQVIQPYFYFVPQESGTYHFRFWAGADEETGDDTFITQDIVITE